MAFASFQDRTETIVTSTVLSTFSISYPATVNNDDLMLFLGANREGIIGATPTGLSTLWELQNTINAWAFFKRADGTEDSCTLEFTTDTPSKLVCNVLRFSAASTTTNPEDGVESSGNSSIMDPPDLNPTGWGAEDTVWVAHGGNHRNTSIATYPANYENTHNGGAGGGGTAGRVTMFLATRRLNATSENPAAFVLAIDPRQHCVNTLAIRPTGVAVDEGFDSEAVLRGVLRGIGVT